MTRSKAVATTLPDPAADAADLRAFAAVARLGAVGRAAEALARTQPSVSARIAALEAAWGTRLFVRGARGMALTPEGARLLPMAEAILRQLEELDAAAGRPVAPRGEIRIGAGDALGREVLPRALARLLRDRPDLEVRLVEGPAPRLLEALRGGAIDVALLVLPPAGELGGGLRSEPIAASGIDVLFPPGRAPRRGSIALDALAGERLVSLQPGSAFRAHLASAFDARRHTFRPAVEVGNLSLVRRFVSAGVGVGPVPAIAFAEPRSIPPVDRRRLAGVPALAYAAVTRESAPLPAIAAILLDLVRREAAGGRGGSSTRPRLDRSGAPPERPGATERRDR